MEQVKKVEDGLLLPIDVGVKKLYVLYKLPYWKVISQFLTNLSFFLNLDFYSHILMFTTKFKLKKFQNLEV